MAKEKKKSLDEVLGNINAKWGTEVVRMGTEMGEYVRIPFTSPRLNYITHGGIPMGKLIEFFGEEHSGKTTTALDIVANYQIMEDAKRVLWVDVEEALDEVWATKLNVDLDNMIIMCPDTAGAESIFDDVLDVMETGEIGLVIIDSFGAMQSDKAYEESVGDKQYGGISQALTNFAKKALVLCHRYNCTVIGLNQLREKINSMYGGTTTTGGRGWKHDITVRLDFRKGYSFDDKYKKVSNDAENPMGNIVMVAMPKNRTCPPNRRNGFYTIRYDSGIDYMYDLTEVCIKCGVIDKPEGSSWYTIKRIEKIYNDELEQDVPTILDDKVAKLQGQFAVSEFLSDEANIDVLKAIEDYLDYKIKEQ